MGYPVPNITTTCTAVGNHIKGGGPRMKGDTNEVVALRCGEQCKN